MKISFCTTCCNRFYQLQQTFEANLELISRDAGTEWVILNFNSRDALHDFMMERLPDLPGNVVYARDLIDRPWHSSIAKNVAHRLASGDVLFNLDGDNYIADALDLVRPQFANGIKGLHLWSGVRRDGTFGRIAFAREVFYELGGYDESFHPVAFQDCDLLLRAVARRLPLASVRSSPDAALKNTKEATMMNCKLEGMSWKACNEENGKRSHANIQAGRLVANVEVAWGRGDVEVFRPPASKGAAVQSARLVTSELQPAASGPH
jgi:hypothetical protein